MIVSSFIKNNKSMKQLLFTLVLTAVAFAGFAQEGEKGYKDANKAFNTFKLDPAGNKAKLAEAVEAIEKAIADPATAAIGKTWQLRGDIFSEIAAQIANTKQLAAQGLGTGNTDDLPKVKDLGLEAFKSYKKVMELALKPGDKKPAIKGIASLQNNLQNLGIFQFEDQDFKSAFLSFAACLEMHDILKENKEKSIFDDPAKYEDQVFYVGIAALSADMKKEAKPYFLKLYEMKADKPAIYEALYNIEAETAGPEAAYKYLSEGRKQYPNEVSLLFAEINHFLRINKLDALISQLEEAIKLEPNNISLYTTMGSVYDNLQQNAMAAGDKAKAEEYTELALKYFNLALEKDPKNIDALYSIGALYYNKAAVMTQELNKLSEDYSRAGIERYNNKKKEVIAQFDVALPYFQRCESINPNDRNTLIALKEIYAKKDDIEMSNEFKARLEKVEAGGKNEKSYFNKQ